MGLFNIQMPRRLPKIDRMVKELAPEFRAYLGEVGDVLVKETKENLSGKILNKRSGRLYDSIQYSVESEPGSWKLIVGSFGDLKYAPVHEKGLTVRTRSGSTFKMPKRSYLWRAYTDKKQQIKQMLKAFANKVTR